MTNDMISYYGYMPYDYITSMGIYKHRLYNRFGHMACHLGGEILVASGFTRLRSRRGCSARCTSSEMNKKQPNGILDEKQPQF